VGREGRERTRQWGSDLSVHVNSPFGFVAVSCNRRSLKRCGLFMKTRRIEITMPRK
jgi:hypothetical protein